MAFLTPGAVFVARCFFYLLFRCTLIVGIRFLLQTQLHILIPTWVLVAGCILSIPAVNISRLVWDEIYQRRRATVLGARLMPRIAGRWPGNIDVLTDAPAKNENSYPGKEWFFLIYDIDAIWYVADGLWDVMERCGTSFNLRMIWEDIVLTCDPDNIKVCFDAINCDFLWRDLTYKTILANDFPNYVKGNPFLDILSPSPMPYLRG